MSAVRSIPAKNTMKSLSSIAALSCLVTSCRDAVPQCFEHQQQQSAGYGGLGGELGGGLGGTVHSGGTGGVAAGASGAAGSPTNTIAGGPGIDGTAGTSSTSVTLPPAQTVFVVEDFERGPKLGETKTQGCAWPLFKGFKPSGNRSGQACDWLGVNTSSCAPEYYCEGFQLAGICPDYIGRSEGAWRGDYSLRIYAELAQDERGFGGIILNIGNKTNPVPPGQTSCVVNRGPISLGKFESLSLKIRAGDTVGNAEIAIEDDAGLQTNPKVLLVPETRSSLPQDEWITANVRICDLLRSETDAGRTTLNREAIVKVLVGVAYQRFRVTNTFQSGPRQFDLDDIVFVPCSDGGCAACP